MRVAILSIVLIQSIFLVPLSAVADTASSTIAKNPTDLPAYPNLWKASVLGGGKGSATLYNQATHDTYETVLAWYRSKLAGASEQESGYVKDSITFSLPQGEQVVVQRPSTGDGTLITLVMNAR
jgi:hypothetical protein